MTRCRLETRDDRATSPSSTCARRHRAVDSPVRDGAAGCRTTSLGADVTLRLRGHVH